MTNKIFFDTSPYIYLLENNYQYFDIVENFIEGIIGRCQMYTSVISLSEFSVIPYKMQRLEEICRLKDFLSATKTNIIKIDEDIAIYSAQIRAIYTKIKGMDALQIATALCSGCDFFLTNDKQLKQIKEISVLTMQDIQQSK